MRIKKLSIASKKADSASQFTIIALLVLTAISVLGQIPSNNMTISDSPENTVDNQHWKAKVQKSITPSPLPPQQIVPIADHHAHLWSLSARSLVMDPILSAVELPDDLKQLLKAREQLVKEESPSVLAKIYTEDAVVLDAMAPIWLQGKKAIDFVSYSLGSFPMVAQAYKVDGSAGYIVGTYTHGEGSLLEHVSNFSLFVRKGADGKWRIAGETFSPKGPPVPKAATAKQLVEKLDAAKIQRAVVLSTAYWFGGTFSKGEDEYEKVRGENDWVAQQVSLYPNRLVGFCSFNPLKEYALEELNRCAKKTSLKGLKLHFGSSRVNLLDSQHVEKVRRVFETANQLKYPVVAHLWIPGKYGREHSETFLNKIVPVAPDIPIQIAHLAATGPGYTSDNALEVYANAAISNDPRLKNLYFDVASLVTDDSTDENMALVVKRLRQLGIRRVLFASDYSPTGENAAPKNAWDAFRRLPLTEEEFRMVATNVAPYAR